VGFHLHLGLINFHSAHKICPRLFRKMRHLNLTSQVLHLTPAPELAFHQDKECVAGEKI
jgi:hypothetical protein